MPFEHLDRIFFNANPQPRELLERLNETAIFTEKSGFGIIINSEKYLSW